MKESPNFNIHQGEEHPLNYQFYDWFDTSDLSELEDGSLVGECIVPLNGKGTIKFVLVWDQGSVVSMSESRYKEKHE